MAAESDVASEIEVLQSIYLDELLVDRTQDGGWEVSLVLYPSTAEDSVSQFVRLTLTLTLDQQYPSSSPAISIHKPRGLSDDKLISVQKCLQLEAQSCLGSPVLYQLIEKAKEILTESNIPHGSCVICLYGFKEGETFTKTNCYHYFHCHCLGRYVSHSESELRQREKELEEDKTRDRADDEELTVVCPVCREPLTYDVEQLLSSPAPQLPELDKAAIGSNFQQKWRELQKLLERQRSKGGIIDPEEESNRFLIHINEAPSVAENGSLDGEVSPGPPVPSASDETGVRAGRFVPGLSHCRGGHEQRRQHQARGQRRGGRSRPQHRRAAPVTEHLDKLSLSSGYTDGPIKAKAQGNHGNHGQQASSQRVRPPRKLTMLRSLQAVVVIVEGEGALIDLSRTPGPTGLHTTSGMGGLHEAGVGPITCTAEGGGPTGVTAGASNIRWWTERGAERRCYDKGQQEGQ
ncbi:E3 ubiquitin-protein ligase RNF25 [Collichthys lucidus]|uniref:E3 ubiquitin-protein ligase RNF25 n=1 Tax=Collichthys lucidus TaxID=240159 RepID=A0A4U5VRN6_COLLU|nr:E3 ubiquitin-protein ligase RNF25 [Collichthys lucidus]